MSEETEPYRHGSSLGLKEELLRRDTAERERNKTIEIATQSMIEKARNERVIVLQRTTKTFTVNRTEIGRVIFMVNLRSGRVLASEIVDEVWSETRYNWSHLEVKYARLWLQAPSLKAVHYDFVDANVFRHFDAKPFVNTLEVRRLKRRARFAWSMSRLVQRIDAMIELLVALCKGSLVFVVWLIGASIVLYGVYFIFGGIGGLLEFGWKNLK